MAETVPSDAMFWQAVRYAKQRFPEFSVRVREDSRFMRFLAKVMFWNPRFLGYFTTTIGYTVYMPQRLVGTVQGELTLQHELVHVEDYDRWGLAFMLSYLFIPLPFVITLRALWEWRGYRVDLKRMMKDTGMIERSYEDFIVRMFTGPAYLWMWPFPWMVRNWIQKVRAEGR